MKQPATTPQRSELPLSAHPPLALDQFIRESGLSPTTCWRYRRKGWLKTCVISNRHYVTREAIAEFNARAERGEFAGTLPNPSGRRASEKPTADAPLPRDLIEPKAGDCSTIKSFLAGVLGGEGAIHLYCWLKTAFEALRAGQRRPGQAVIIIGPPDCGKSVIQHQIITPILGGRSADAKSFLFGRTDFNAELVGAEHLLVEEVPSSAGMAQRTLFGERIKEIVVYDTVRLHEKYRDAVTVSPFWRLSITLNDNPEKLRCLPPLTDDLADKIIMLTAKPAPEFWQRFADAPDPWAAFRAAIDAELPAFADLLLTMPIPENLRDRRFGVTSFIPAEIAQTIFESDGGKGKESAQ